ncbi:MAG: MFS transporter [Myxococcota bacterium]|nr:MFS transporter [Myxococcota bacterium]
MPAHDTNLRSNIEPHTGLLSLLAIATFFEGFDTKLAGLVQPLLGREWGASTEELGLVLGLSSLGMVLAFFVIHLADWIGRRPVFLGALAAYTVLTLATAFSPNLVVYTALQFFARMAMVVELSLAYLILSETVASDFRGRANGMLGAFAALGAAVPLALMGPLKAMDIGWRGLFVIGSLPVLLLPMYLKRIEETAAYRERIAATASRHFDWRSEWALIRSLFDRSNAKRLAGATVLWFGVNFWAGTAMGFLTIYTFGERGWNESDISWLPLGTIPVGLAGYLFCGVAMDHFGRKGATSLYLIAAFVVTVICYQAESKAAIYLAWSLLVGLNGIWTIVTTWTLELFPTQSRATALGVSANLFGRMGMVVGPIVAGMLSSAWSSTSSAITALAFVMLLCLPIVWWVLPETRGAGLGDEADRS